MTDPAKARSLYRSLLRELPPRPILLKPRQPIHSQLRKHFVYKPQKWTAPERAVGLAVAEQYKAYFQAQRHYVSLIEQYNPGMGMSQEERVRLSARRVGMDLPRDYGKEHICKVPERYDPCEHWMPATRLRSVDLQRLEKRERGQRNFEEYRRRQREARERRLAERAKKEVANESDREGI